MYPRPYLGGDPDPSLEAKTVEGVVYLGDLWKYPRERIADGCPGGYYRGAFVESLLPYLRTRDHNGGRVQNHRLDACSDRLIWQAVQYFEAQQEANLENAARLRRAKKT